MQIRVVGVVALFRPDKQDETDGYLWQLLCECAKWYGKDASMACQSAT